MNTVLYRDGYTQRGNTWRGVHGYGIEVMRHVERMPVRFRSALAAFIFKG